MKRLIPAVLSVLLLLLLSGCGSSGRYSMSEDRAPRRSLNPDRVREAEPEPVVHAAAGNRSPYTVLGGTYYVMSSREAEDYVETGTASWYGMKFDGHLTANGEVFSYREATAAHRSLPIPSFVRVTNLRNGRSLIVRVNDRGPFHGDRLIDLSYGAALKLGFAGVGTAPVRVNAVVADRRGRIREATERRRVSDNVYLQLGAFRRRRNANRLAEDVEDLVEHPIILRSDEVDGRLLYQVRVGPFNDEQEMWRLRERLIAAGLEKPYPVQD